MFTFSKFQFIPNYLKLGYWKISSFYCWIRLVSHSCYLYRFYHQRPTHTWSVCNEIYHNVFRYEYLTFQTQIHLHNVIFRLTQQLNVWRMHQVTQAATRKGLTRKPGKGRERKAEWTRWTVRDTLAITRDKIHTTKRTRNVLLPDTGGLLIGFTWVKMLSYMCEIYIEIYNYKCIVLEKCTRWWV